MFYYLLHTKMCLQLLQNAPADPRSVRYSAAAMTPFCEGWIFICLYFYIISHRRQKQLRTMDTHTQKKQKQKQLDLFEFSWKRLIQDFSSRCGEFWVSLGILVSVLKPTSSPVIEGISLTKTSDKLLVGTYFSGRWIHIWLTIRKL